MKERALKPCSRQAGKFFKATRLATMLFSFAVAASFLGNDRVYAENDANFEESTTTPSDSATQGNQAQTNSVNTEKQSKAPTAESRQSEVIPQPVETKPEVAQTPVQTPAQTNVAPTQTSTNQEEADEFGFESAFPKKQLTPREQFDQGTIAAMEVMTAAFLRQLAASEPKRAERLASIRESLDREQRTLKAFEAHAQTLDKTAEKAKVEAAKNQLVARREPKVNGLDSNDAARTVTYDENGLATAVKKEPTLGEKVAVKGAPAAIEPIGPASSVEGAQVSTLERPGVSASANEKIFEVPTRPLPTSEGAAMARLGDDSSIRLNGERSALDIDIRSTQARIHELQQLEVTELKATTAFKNAAKKAFKVVPGIGAALVIFDASLRPISVYALERDPGLLPVRYYMHRGASLAESYTSQYAPESVKQEYRNAEKYARQILGLEAPDSVHTK